MKNVNNISIKIVEYNKQILDVFLKENCIINSKKIDAIKNELKKMNEKVINSFYANVYNE